MKTSYTSICSEDFDQFRDWELAHGIEAERRQLSRGRGIFRGDFVVVGEIIAWRYSESLRTSSEFTLPQDTIEISITRYPDELNWCGIQCSGSSATIHFGGEDYYCVLPAGGVSYGFVIPKASPFLRSLMREDLLSRALLRREATTPVPENLANSICTSINSLFDKRHSNPDPISAGMEVISSNCHLLLDKCFPNRASSCTVTGAPLVREARELIKSRMVDLTVQEMLSELNVPRRSLERAFRRQLGLTPHQYLLVERLHAARRMLKRNASVLSAVAQCGFADASSFAQFYARHFGELPSQTKIRSR